MENAKVTSVTIRGTITVQDTLTTKEIPTYTVIDNDGIYCKGTNNQFFKVQNTANGQKIYAKGLSDTKGTSGDGSLYVSGNFVNAFKELCNTLAEAFEDVRFQGNNKDHSNDIISALNNVINKLNDTSLIATS